MLRFCQPCGELCVKNVKGQLEKLFNQVETLQPNSCAICYCLVDDGGLVTESSSATGTANSARESSATQEGGEILELSGMDQSVVVEEIPLELFCEDVSQQNPSVASNQPNQVSESLAQGLESNDGYENSESDISYNGDDIEDSFQEQNELGEVPVIEGSKVVAEKARRVLEEDVCNKRVEIKESKSASTNVRKLNVTPCSVAQLPVPNQPIQKMPLPYQCKFCSKGFSSEEECRSHVMQHLDTERKMYRQNVRVKRLAQRTDGHAKVNNKKKKHGVYHLFDQLKEQLVEEVAELLAPTRNTRFYRCKVCEDKDFRSLSLFLGHMKASHGYDKEHDKPWKCKRCNSQFKTKAWVLQHCCKENQNSDQDKKQHSLKENQSVDQHEKRRLVQLLEGLKGQLVNEVAEMLAPVRNRKRLYRCKLCRDQDFTSLSFFLDHMKECHGYDKEHEKPWKCGRCSSQFKLQSWLLQHVCRENQDLDHDLDQDQEQDPLQLLKGQLVKEIAEMLAPTWSTRRMYRCKVCEDKDFTCLRLFLDHMKECHRYEQEHEKPWQCRRCSFQFELKSQLLKHISTEHQDLDQEQRSFQLLKGQLVKEIAEMLAPTWSTRRMYRCKVCGNKDFTNLRFFLDHMKECHGYDKEHKKPWQCRRCSSQFKVKSTLLTHACRENQEKRTVRCTFQGCDKTFVNACQLRMHKQNHIKKYVCHICGKKMRDKYKLVNHLRLKHYKVRPFKCQYCPKTFTDAYSAKCHERLTHLKMRRTGDKYLDMCEYCGERVRKLSIHFCLKKRSQMQTIKCTYDSKCRYTTWSESLLKRHLEKHESNTAFVTFMHRPVCSCKLHSTMLADEEKQADDSNQVGLDVLEPRFISGTTNNTVLIGGNPEMQRTVKWYVRILDNSQCHTKKTIQEAGEALCWELLQALLTDDLFLTHNLFRYHPLGKRPVAPKQYQVIDTKLLDAIFDQVRCQFPSFPCDYDLDCKTARYLNNKYLKHRKVIKQRRKKQERMTQKTAGALPNQKEGNSKEEGCKYHEKKRNEQSSEERQEQLEADDSEDVLPASRMPRFIEGPTRNTMLLGGDPQLVRTLNWYSEVIRKSGCDDIKSSFQAAQQLCWWLLKSETKDEVFLTHNIVGFINVKYGGCIPCPKVDEKLLKAILLQASFQYPSFPCRHDDDFGYCATAAFLGNRFSFHKRDTRLRVPQLAKEVQIKFPSCECCKEEETKSSSTSKNKESSENMGDDEQGHEEEEEEDDEADMVLPKYVSGPDEDTMLLGGDQTRKRDLEWYMNILNGPLCKRKRSTSELDAGRDLCYALLKAELDEETVMTHNLNGVTFVSSTFVKSYPKIDSTLVECIYKQVKLQFPGFSCKHDVIICKSYYILKNRLQTLKKSFKNAGKAKIAANAKNAAKAKNTAKAKKKVN